MRKKICIVGMLDSVHLAKWLENFKDSGIDFIIFPSKKFKHLHPILGSLITSKSDTSYRLYLPFVPKALQGYFAFMLFELHPPVGKKIRAWMLHQIITQKNLRIVHALELQGAGYLINSVINNYGDKDFNLIVTNYGSDIYFYHKFESHKEILVELLLKADFYSAECLRDYDLASKIGFGGTFLPCFPNAGGFDLDFFDNARRASNRNLILVKSYGGTFGRGDLCIEIAKDLLIQFPTIDFFFYSVTTDILNAVNSLAKQYPTRVRYSTVSKSLPQDELLGLFKEARVYLGLSESDGISTSFLNALVSGAYPIQSGTSCANEWIGRGAKASIVQLQKNEIVNALQAAIIDDGLVDQAQVSNLKIAKSELDKKVLSAKVKSFYNNVQ